MRAFSTLHPILASPSRYLVAHSLATASKAASPHESNNSHQERPQYRLQWFRHPVDKQREEDRKYYTSLMDHVRKRMAEGTAQPSMATIALERQAEFGLSELEMAYTLAGPWDAGVGTVSYAQIGPGPSF